MFTVQDTGDRNMSTVQCSFPRPVLSAAGWVQEVVLILTGPINPRRPVLVKGWSETGTPSAVTGMVCQKREEAMRQLTTH